MGDGEAVLFCGRQDVEQENQQAGERLRLGAARVVGLCTRPGTDDEPVAETQEMAGGTEKSGDARSHTHKTMYLASLDVEKAFDVAQAVMIADISKYTSSVRR